MIVFENRFRRRYESERRKRIRREDNRRLAIVALVLCLVAWSVAPYFDKRSPKAEAAVGPAVLVVIGSALQNQVDARLCVTCHNGGAE